MLTGLYVCFLIHKVFYIEKKNTLQTFFENEYGFVNS